MNEEIKIQLLEELQEELKLWEKAIPHSILIDLRLAIAKRISKVLSEEND